MRRAYAIQARAYGDEVTVTAASESGPGGQVELRVRIPYHGQRVTYSQEVSEQNRGVFNGTVALPAGVTD